MLAQREPAGRRTLPSRVSGAKRPRPVTEIRAQPPARPPRISFNDRSALDMLRAGVGSPGATTGGNRNADQRRTRYCQINGYRAEGAPGIIHDHSASTAFLQGAASCAGCARGSLLAINNTVAPASGGWKTRYERSDRKVSPSDLWYWLRLLRPGAVAARRDVVGALHARQAPNDRHAAPGDGIGRDNRLRQGDPPLIAARVRAGHLIVRFGSLHSSSRRVGDLDLAPIS